MRRWEGRTNEPVRWALFAGGGQVSALVLPALVVVFGFLLPFGVLGEPDVVYARLVGFMTHPLGSLAVLALLALLLWHGSHSGFHALHDLQIEPPEIVRVLIYGLALAIPAAGWAVILWYTGPSA